MDQLQLQSQHRQSGRALAAIAGYGLLLLLSLSTAQAAVSVARVATLIGVVDVVRADTGAIEPLELRTPIYLNDTLRTDTGSRVKLLLRDNSILKLGPESELIIDKLKIGRTTTKTDIRLLRGRVRSVVGEKLTRGSSYEIRTGVAVAGVRGTDWEVVEIPQQTADANGGSDAPPATAVRTFEGLVRVQNSNPGTPGGVQVGPNSFTLVLPNRPPSAPQFIPPGQDVLQRVRQGGGGGEEGQGGEPEGDPAGLPGNRPGARPGQGPGNGESDEPPANAPRPPANGPAAHHPEPDPLDRIEGNQLPVEPPPPESLRPNGLTRTPPPAPPAAAPPPPPPPPPPRIEPIPGTIQLPIQINIPAP